jgi:hypothetical protein
VRSKQNTGLFYFLLNIEEAKKRAHDSRGDRRSYPYRAIDGGFAVPGRIQLSKAQTWGDSNRDSGVGRA